MPSNEVLIAENALLREQLHATQEQLRVTQTQLSAAQELNTHLIDTHNATQKQLVETNHHEREYLIDAHNATQKQLVDAHKAERAQLHSAHCAERAQLHSAHRAERMRMLDTIDQKVDTLLLSHNETSARKQDQIKTLGMQITINPNSPRKHHGFAVVLKPKHPGLSDGVHELLFIAGQAAYVERKLNSINPREILFPFRLINNAINLRNNFARTANQRLVETLGVQQAEASDIIFRCCRSQWIDYEDGFPKEEITTIIDELIALASQDVHVEDGYLDNHSETKQLLDEERLAIERLAIE